MATTTESIGHPATDRKDAEAPPCGCVGLGDRADAMCDEATRLWEGLLAAREEVLSRGGRSKGHQGRIDAFHERREAYYAHLGRAS